MNTVDVSYVFSTVLTFFIIMLIGAVSRILGVIDWQATKKLSGLVINVTQPLLIIGAFQTSYSADKLKIALSLIGVSAVILVALSFLASLFFKGSEKADRNVLEFGTVFANWSYLGYPILAALFGEIGYFYGACFTLFFNVYIRLYGVILLGRGKKGSRPLRDALLNPGTIAAAVGVLLFIFRITLPTFLLDTFKVVGDMTFPLSMLIVGSLMCNQPLTNLFKVKLYTFSIAKLIIAPVLTLTVCVLMHKLFGFDKGLTYICVAMTCLPSSADAALYSDLYKSNSSLGASCVGVTTLFSVVTVPVMMWFTNKLFELI